MSKVHEISTLLYELGDVISFVCLDDRRDTGLVREVEDGGSEGWVEGYLPNEPIFTALQSGALVLRVEACDGGELSLAFVDVVCVTPQDALDSVDLCEGDLRL